MAAGGEIEAHEGVARLHQRHEHFGIGRGAGMRLHIGEGAAEQFGHTIDRKPLGDIDILAAAVIALTRQAFGIFVGQNRALRLEHGAADDVLGRDQLDFVALAAELKLDRLGDFRIALGDAGREEFLFCDIGLGSDRHDGVLASFHKGSCLRPVIHRRPCSRQPAAARRGIFRRLSRYIWGLWGLCPITPNSAKVIGQIPEFLGKLSSEDARIQPSALSLS